MAKLLADIRKLNNLGGHALAEPFAGGAGASLQLLYREETNKIFINDADPAIYSLWWTLTNRPKKFLELLHEASITIEEWKRQKQVYSLYRNVSRLRLGFSAFYLNRCNRSGIIMNAGPIGGFRQDGEWKIDARFNKNDLLRRCERVAEYRSRIEVSGQDGIEFIDGLNKNSTHFFIDPPYYNKGKTLYLNSLNESYHVALSKKLKSMKKSAWILTYDDCPEIRQLYQDWAMVKPFKLRYVASDRRQGNELLIAPKWTRLPSEQSSLSINW